MSRSYKKPFHGICVTKSNEHKVAKDSMTKSTRRMIDNNEKDIPSGTYYKKMHGADYSWRPDDGKMYNPECKKAYRK